MATPHDDLARRAHVLRSRLRRDEGALAIAYPQDEERLQADVERERAQLAELDEQIEDAKEEVRAEALAAVEAYFDARATLVALNGHFADPGFADPLFMKVASGADSTQDASGVKAALLRSIEMPPATMPELPEGQRLHNERLKNERAGRGYFTVDELRRRSEDPVTFEYGVGARVSRRNTPPVDA